jgi:cytochrome d ubiquinol oxidase subunit I
MIEQEWAIILARIQFAFTVSFHFLFPAFSIGLASFLAVLEGLWLKTGKGVYANLYRYWLKIFAVVFAMGVVSGIVMSYQFGTNWSVFSDKAGPVIGPLMAYEVLTAFFLEAGFLGVMLFGINKVGRKLHFVATLAVAIGTFISAFWILSVNSWMQTPVGYEIAANGQFMPGDSWWTIIFNPSFPYRLVHTGGLSDYGLCRGRGWRLAFVERQSQSGGPQNVLHGDVDGSHRRAASGCGG